MRQLNEAELLAVSGGNCPDDWPIPDIPDPEVEIPVREPAEVQWPEPEQREPEGPPRRREDEDDGEDEDD